MVKSEEAVNYGTGGVAVNEEIRVLKSRMAARGQELNNNLNDGCPQSTTTTTTTRPSGPCSGPIYFPINHHHIGVATTIDSRRCHQANAPKKSATATTAAGSCSTYCRTESYEDFYSHSERTSKMTTNRSAEPGLSHHHQPYNQHFYYQQQQQQNLPAVVFRTATETSEFSETITDNKLVMISNGETPVKQPTRVGLSSGVGGNSLSLSPEKKYTSSVEIPAELLKIVSSIRKKNTFFFDKLLYLRFFKISIKYF